MANHLSCMLYRVLCITQQYIQEHAHFFINFIPYKRHNCMLVFENIDYHKSCIKMSITYNKNRSYSYRINGQFQCQCQFDPLMIH